jgi:hypothetical protein
LSRNQASGICIHLSFFSSLSVSANLKWWPYWHPILVERILIFLEPLAPKLSDYWSKSCCLFPYLAEIINRLSQVNLAGTRDACYTEFVLVHLQILGFTSCIDLVLYWGLINFWVAGICICNDKCRGCCIRSHQPQSNRNPTYSFAKFLQAFTELLWPCCCLYILYFHELLLACCISCSGSHVALQIQVLKILASRQTYLMLFLPGQAHDFYEKGYILQLIPVISTTITGNFVIMAFYPL